jgi:hypothetical protein
MGAGTLGRTRGPCIGGRPYVQLWAIREQHPVATRVLYALKYARLKRVMGSRRSHTHTRASTAHHISSQTQRQRTCSSTCPMSSASCRDEMPLTRVKNDTRS